MDSLIDKIIADKYEVLDLIGSGGYGSVYKAYQPNLKRKIALKVLHSQYMDNERITQRFHNEAVIGSTVSHPNVVRVFDYGISKEPYLAFMAMDYVDGSSLKEVLAVERQKEKRELGLEESLHIIIQLCEALSAIHKEGIVHCDVKPANIKLTNENNDRNFVKLIDFGIAIKKSDDAQELAKVDRPGTSQYMSPEQCELKELAREYDVHRSESVLKKSDRILQKFNYRSDIYSAGCVLYEILTGHPPYEGGSATKTEQMHVTAPIPDLELDFVDPAIKLSLADIVSRALAKNPDDRYQNANELQTAVESVQLSIDQLRAQKTNRFLLVIKHLWLWLSKMARKFPNRMNLLFLVLLSGLGFVACVYIPGATAQMLYQGIELRPLIYKLTSPPEMDQSVYWQLTMLDNEKICKQIGKAQSFKNEGNLNAAIIEYQDALFTAESLHVNHEEIGAEIMSQLALCYLFVGNSPKARQLSEEALDVLQKLGSYDKIKALLASLVRAQVLAQTNEDNAARAEFQHMQRTLYGADIKRRFDQVAYAESFLADYLRSHREFEQSSSYYKSAEQRWAGFESDGAYNRCALLDQMALLYLTTRQFDLARTYLMKALSALESSADRTNLASAQLAFHMAQADWEQHKYLPAILERIEAKGLLNR